MEYENNRNLCNFIAQKIKENSQNRITFADYMNWVLYHPEYGYYSINKPKLGAEGDFVTSPYLGSDFGEMLAEQFFQIWEIMDCPNAFTLVEMGAGQGILASDILLYLQKKYPDFFQCLNYIIIEKSNFLKAQQQHQLKKTLAASISIQWCDLEDIPNNNIIGCFFSNELVDAFPVHQIIVQDQQLQEIYITLDSEVKFKEIIAELSTEKITDYFKLIDIDLCSNSYPERYRTEVNLAALDWIKTLVTKLNQGFILTIDYGYTAQRYYLPSRKEGTLQCYYQHSHHNDPYLNIGRQDITAHVNFTALQLYGKDWGIDGVGFTQQALFLMALGLGDRISALSQPSNYSISEILQRRECLHSLIDPMGLGNFGVLLQSKGLSPSQQQIPLQGFSFPI
ncbi:Protein arginine methyltransferase NDUFAF7 homolog, mitochondrial [Planktothrix agardhii]|jgi:SAM-dependent MidA family methyltransferase|uniref:class I SAM-dependent methyltransferase n=1 Tax=Planktothrix agardhii TaxID=1160 RepID=UPI001A2A0E52|nr:class I SAM-dependent methyltransferase [Planktothrix agardhii]MBG0748085.1 class I SAM-dependent methyltransferase [Planktothrix agardhii KL2]MCF3577687.1 class I SAM-dependent methyltransferase [Planktothrix agardhii 1812]MCF3582033.1 class I SAM-dependent methyltransferase [Planktothrix agardhii 1811]CAD5954551.1 Protein arginine methyltransferase NDUFAF7 homolog, mitochondrial [Planktothrix agardhii]CAD5974132.1 Protein arginine methyltransferase NDUFAF7 homolog, mitochondrial [Planktot